MAKFKRFAINIWGVNPDNKTDGQIANEGLDCMKEWMQQLGVAMNLKEIGVTKNMLKGIADSTLVMEGGYKVLTPQEIYQILVDSYQF